MGNKKRHPVQPLELDPHDGVLRFKRNQIVRDLLDLQALRHPVGDPERNAEVKGRLSRDKGVLDMNQIATLHAQGVYSTEDMEQLAQLIGYSHSGAPSYVSETVRDVTLTMHETEGLSEIEARFKVVDDQLSRLLGPLHQLASRAFAIHPTDLQPVIGEFFEGEGTEG